MSGFEWVPDVGDKIYSLNGLKGIVLPDGCKPNDPASKRCFLNIEDGNVWKAWSGLESWRGTKPRGKKTKAKYKAAKKAWEAENAEIKAGDVVVCVDSDGGNLQIVKHKAYEVVENNRIWIVLKGTDISYRISRFRKATPAEIEAYKQSLRTVWDLKINEDCYLLGAHGGANKRKWNHCLSKHRERGLIHMTEQQALDADAKRMVKL